MKKCDVLADVLFGEIIPSFGQVMGIDGEAVDAEFGAGVDRPCCNGLVKQRNQWLGQSVSERP